MTKKDEQLGKTHFFTKEKIFIACIIALLLIVAYFFGKSNSLYLGSSGIQEPTPTVEAIETPVPTPIPTDKPIPFPKTNTIPFVSPAPVNNNIENNSIQENQRIQALESCQKQINDYNSCMDRYNTQYQNHSNCIAQYNLELQQYYNSDVKSGLLPSNYCGPVPSNFCYKPFCSY